jgi:hypothetical protein
MPHTVNHTLHAERVPGHQCWNLSKSKSNNFFANVIQASWDTRDHPYGNDNQQFGILISSVLNRLELAHNYLVFRILYVNQIYIISWLC